jgi:hypothetical protein
LTPLPRLGQGEGFFKMQAKKVILGSGRLRAGSIIAEEEMAIWRSAREMNRDLRLI